MTRTRVPPVLVTGATGRVGLRRDGPSQRGGRAGSGADAALRGGGDVARGVEVVSGDLAVPESLDAGCKVSARCSSSGPRRRHRSGDRRASRGPPEARRLFSSPHQTPHPFSSSRIPWRSSTPKSRSKSRPPGSSRRSSGRGCSRRTRYPGGQRDPHRRCRPVALRRAETAPVDERDVAAVAAHALYQDGHAGGDYVLTGPESLVRRSR